MALRRAEYALAIYRQFGRFPKQIILYVGEPKLRMSAVLSGPDATQPDFAFRYTLLDIRDLESAAFLESAYVEDNVLAILTRLQNQIAAIRQIFRMHRRIGRVSAPRNPCSALGNLRTEAPGAGYPGGGAKDADLEQYSLTTR